MKRLILKPDGWPCSYKDAPAGYILIDNQLCFKTKYATTLNEIEGYNSSGEFLDIYDEKIVQPVYTEWEEI